MARGFQRDPACGVATRHPPALGSADPMRYPSDELTDAERARLAPHFTDLDGPVFALTNLPETVKGALFARYSRYPGTLRRLFLDEFADSLPEAAAGYDGDEGKRAAELYERIFVGYGDDSVAQLGGAHVACEWTSNILTKILQRPRLGAYLEQSTRYIAYDAPMPGGGYRYYRDPRARPRVRAGDGLLFDAYADALPIVRAWVDETYPRADGESDAARRRAVNAKAYDLLRGLLPAASLSHMGIYATGQAYEQLILHLLGHPLPEARHYGGLILDAIKAVMPSFVARVERPERGGEWVALPRAPARGRRALGRAARARPRRQRARTARRCGCCTSTATRTQLLAALLFEAAGVSEERTREEVARLSRRRPRAAARRPRRRARQPPPPPGPRLRGAALPLRDRLGLRRVPRPPAPPHADRAVAGPDARPRRRHARTRSSRPARATSTHARSSAPRRSTSGSPPPACATPRRTRSASASASATCSTSTRARRCTRSSCAPAARATRATARSRTRCTRRSPRTTRRSRRR